MKKFIDTKFKRELLVGVIIIFCIIFVTGISVRKIHQREDLALLQIDFTGTVVNVKKCFESGGVVQDPSLGEPGKVFICSNQDIINDTFLNLQKLSRRNFKYRYISSKKCFSRNCSDNESDNKIKRINIGRGNKLVLSCDIAEGICYPQ
jgi:hypothetical protein